MTLRRDPALRTLRRLTLVVGAALLDLDIIWGQGLSVAGWLLRVAFTALILCEIIISRTEIERVRLGDKVIARACGTREYPWQGVAVLFTATRVVALRRRAILGSIRGPLTEAPRSAVQLRHERHGAFIDRVRCDWPDGTAIHMRVRPGDMRHLEQAIQPAERPRNCPFARMVDWVRAATTYEE